MKYKVKSDDDYLLKVGELKLLLWWAATGVESMRGGSGEKKIIPLIKRLADDVHTKIDSKKDPLKFAKNLA